ncbi:MAG: sensor domain-containing diguanylate cyclase [Vulcanimicrobiaceae bacterium]
MNDDASQRPALADLSGRPASRTTSVAALSFVLAMLALALASLAFGEHPGPVVVAFIPVVGALWAAAELLTAYLLLSQFTVNGVRLFLVLAAAYAFSALLTIPYVLNFPGALGGAGSPDARQISFVLWSIWHLAFPAIVALGMLRDRGLGDRDEVQMRRDTVGVLAVVTSVCIALSAATYLLRGMLPVLIDQGRFTPLFEFVIAPAIILANLATALLVLRRKPLTALHVWLAVALAIAAIDAALNGLAHARYSPSWYVGKVLTLITASVVLMALLAEVAALYRRVGALAMNDPLTGLRNRRAFDDSTAWAFNVLRRQRGEVAMMMIDVDFFKAYNDLYGHVAGDECLCRVAESLRLTLRRGADVVARYGGEEFVVLLPLASRESSLEAAERLRASVQALAIPHTGGVATFGVVTVSVGVAHTRDITTKDPGDLLVVADRALYTAKERRNAVVVETREAGAIRFERDGLRSAVP